MSGKKKNRTKLKRTGTASQTAPTAQVGKTDASLPEDSVEVVNGDSAAELNESPEVGTEAETAIVEEPGTTHFARFAVHGSRGSRGLF